MGVYSIFTSLLEAGNSRGDAASCQRSQYTLFNAGGKSCRSLPA
jgi:hypothetical protein